MLSLTFLRYNDGPVNLEREDLSLVQKGVLEREHVAFQERYLVILLRGGLAGNFAKFISESEECEKIARFIHYINLTSHITHNIKIPKSLHCIPETFICRFSNNHKLSVSA